MKLQIAPSILSILTKQSGSDAEFSRIILSTLVTDPLVSPSSMPGNSSANVENELMEMTCGILTHPLAQLKFPRQRVL